MAMTSAFRQCDVCQRMTTRIHHTEVTGVDTSVCDECCGYDADAYDEPKAQYMTEAEWQADRNQEHVDALDEALVHCDATQVAQAILDIFSDEDIGFICGRLITPRKRSV